MSDDGMRVRQRLTVNRVTGATEFTEELLPAAEFGQRAAELKASLPDIDDAEARRLAVLICNGCGARVTLDFDAPEYPDGWRELPDGDFCPRCRPGGTGG
jgi:hypothetical protein